MKVLANFEDNQKISSNSAIDDLLGGGFEKGVITQIFGPPSSGKSNIVFTRTWRSKNLSNNSFFKSST
ncbi:hypothetical protein IKE96_01365 [bacterium]|nr:hypothetical protein [bacterium]